MPSYKDVFPNKETRSNPRGICDCKLCIIASKDGRPEKQKKGPKTSKAKRSSLTICSICKQTIGKGITHKCSVASASCNLVSHAETLPEKQQEQVASTIIFKKAEQVTGRIGHKSDLKINLATKGRKTNIVLNPSAQNNVVFTEESIINLQKYLGESNAGMKKIAHFLRVHAGRKVIPPYIGKTISNAGKSLDEIYHLTSLKLDVGNGVKEDRPVFYGNATEIVEKVCEIRGISGPCLIKLMADSGQGSFKVSLIILPENYDPDEEHSRRTYAEGGAIAKDLSLNGVKRVIIVVNVPDIKETYDNCQTLWDLAKINEIPYLFLADIKLILTILGLQTAAAGQEHPQSWEGS